MPRDRPGHRRHHPEPAPGLGALAHVEEHQVTAVLAAAARAVTYGILGLAALAGMLWAALSPLPPAPAVRLAVMFVTFSGSGVALEWLGKRRRKEDG
jgi:hypothetical protein